MIGFLQRRAGRAFTPMGRPSGDGDRLTAAIPSRELLAQGTAGEAEAMYMRNIPSLF